MRVLIVEDDAELCGWLQATLSKAIGTVDTVSSVDAARAALAVAKFELVVLDRRLPDGDGVQLLRELRALRPRPGTVVLTAWDDPNEIADALNNGADDYVGKPFEPAELIARARAVVRRCSLDQGVSVEVGNLRFDVKDRCAYCNDVPFMVPRRELAILELLIRRIGRVVLRETLNAAVYSFDDEIESNAFDSHVSRLRRRLREAGCSVTIRSIRGVGYLLSSDASE
ncbi:response regulator transcription factor [Bradyrhizobium liaoningense]|uniref:response regulator n=1 Tax=Bradyrhizobium liaoningense TaxID=43992 RepID=UPI001BA9BD14|nr:response regulator transcription factor [Bradyrhizobium liaoningense]MBR0718797.1 response regulator transcription factor [Bradyrhizobium liaoningense]